MTTLAPRAVITDPAVAVDHLLDARCSILSVQDSTLGTGELHEALKPSLVAVDAALVLLIRMQEARAAA